MARVHSGDEVRVVRRAVAAVLNCAAGDRNGTYIICMAIGVRLLMSSARVELERVRAAPELHQLLGHIYYVSECIIRVCMGM